MKAREREGRRDREEEMRGEVRRAEERGRERRGNGKRGEEKGGRGEEVESSDFSCEVSIFADFTHNPRLEVLIFTISTSQCMLFFEDSPKKV